MKTILTFILLLASIGTSFAQTSSNLDTALVSRATNKDSILVKYFDQLNPHKKNIKFNESDVKAHLNAFFTRVSSEGTARNSLRRSYDSIARALTVTKAKLEKIKSDSVDSHNFYKRSDTLIFRDYVDGHLHDLSLRNKMLAIKFVIELINFNSMTGPASSIDIKQLNDKIDSFEKSNIDWSPVQKDYISKTIKSAKYNLAYLDIVSDKFYRLLKEKIITQSDIAKLKQANKEPIQQKFLTEMMGKLNWQ